MSFRHRLRSGTERLLAALLAVLLVGSALAFGGAVWWAPMVLAGLTACFVIGSLVLVGLDRRVRILKSPLTAIGLLAIAFALVQLAPLPAPVARRLSPRSHEAYTLGFFPDRVRTLVPSMDLPEPGPVRTPISVDRSATVRWVAGAAVCLALFWGVSHFTDRLGRLYVIWGSLVAAFFLNTVLAVVQVLTGNGSLYGFLQPGQGPDWAPSWNDLATAPSFRVLRTIPGPAGQPAWATPIPDRPFLIGTMMGGPGAYLALASIGLPLALGLLLQLLAPRGSRERLLSRLGESGHGGLVTLLIGLLGTATVLVGLIAGPWFSPPFVVAMLLVGLPSAWPSGLRWGGIGLTLLSVAGIGAGILGGQLHERLFGQPTVVTVGRTEAAISVWSDALRIASEFPIAGTGLGSFASVYPLYKSRDEASTTALSTLLQWWVESGFAGLALVAVGLLWILWRLPGGVRRVGTADRALVFGLIGAAVGFSLYATIHWTIELTAIAIAASALGGACNRWLAGGTDLFVERG